MPEQPALPAAGLAAPLVELLNQLLALDPEAVQEIMLRRVAVDAAVSKQTDVGCVVRGTEVKTTAVGILNGALSAADQPLVAMVMDTSDKVVAFTVLPTKSKP